MPIQADCSVSVNRLISPCKMEFSRSSKALACSGPGGRKNRGPVVHGATGSKRSSGDPWPWPIMCRPGSTCIDSEDRLAARA
jgi:hypothetical protein